MAVARRTKWVLLGWLGAAVWLSAAHAQEPASQKAKGASAADARSAGELVHRTWTVDGVAREALVSAPATAKQVPAPVVFVFHGHGGTMRNAARTFAIHWHWPEAIVVYPQGLNTPGRLTDPEGKKPGWQSTVGDQKDRDLNSFDAMLAALKADYRVDDKRIYSTGHSNGGGFTYLLWAARPDVLAAVAPSAAAALRNVRDLKPKPVLHVAGEQDALVKYEWQKMTVERLLAINHCEKNAQPWHGMAGCKLYPSSTGTPVVTLIHPGGHKFLAEAPAAIVAFFKEHARP
jgi:polyhydroxybutyrate depolymerase